MAAVIGRDFDLDAVAAALHVDRDVAAASLEPVAMVQEGARPGAYQFSHTLAREAVYEQLTAVEKGRLHRAVGEVLEARTPIDDTRAGELAHHFDRAGVAEKATWWLFDSGRRARRSHLNDEAADRLRRAQGWLAREQRDTVHGVPRPIFALELHEELGDARRAAAR